MRTDWSFEEIVIKAVTLPAVIFQGIIDFWSPPPFSAARQTAFPIPGCPSPSDCRRFDCVGTCSEATEGRMESDGHMLAEPLADWEKVLRAAYYSHAGDESHYSNDESSSLAVMQPAEKSPPHVSVGATARGEGPGSDSDIPPSPEPGCSTSDLLRAAAVEIEYYLCRENPSTQRNGHEFTAKLRDCADRFDRAGEKLHGVESGQDMGASAFSSVDHAASFFEGHKKARR